MNTETDYISFFITNGDGRTTSFVKINDFFFISSGSTIWISRKNLIRSINVDEKNMATFNFLYDNDPCIINLYDDINYMIGDYIKNFRSMVKRYETNNIKVDWAAIFKNPDVAKINIKPYIDSILQDKPMTVSIIGNPAFEWEIPSELKLIIVDANMYVLDNWQDWYGTQMIIRNYEVFYNGNITFKDAITHSSNNL